jgi:hypothetical protein
MVGILPISWDDASHASLTCLPILSLPSLYSHVDKGRNQREFKVGDHVFLKVKAKRSSLKFGNCSKLTTRYCGSFEILERIGPCYPHFCG